MIKTPLIIVRRIRPDLFYLMIFGFPQVLYEESSLNSKRLPVFYLIIYVTSKPKEKYL